MLEEWRLSMRRKKSNRRNWSCPKCVDEYWNERDQRRSDTAGSAATHTPFDALKLEVVELKAEVVELNAEVDKWKELAQMHVAYKAAHVDEIRKLRQEIDQLRAQATAVPDDD